MPSGQRLDPFSKSNRLGHFTGNLYRPEDWVYDDDGSTISPDKLALIHVTNPLADPSQTIADFDRAHTQVTAESAGTPGQNGAALLDPKSSAVKLDTGNADADRQRTGSLLGQLAGQAQTGAGPWEGALHDSTQRNMQSSEALGQSNPAAGYQTSLRNILNSQGAAQQQSAGQGNILREQSKQSAQQQLGGLLSNQGNLDLNQSASQAAATQAANEANAASNAQNTQNTINMINGGVQAVESVASHLSDGGKVPGQPEVFGDNERNDTVPAWLSPGEVVLPRSVVNSPDAPSRAADFVAALRARKGHGVPHFDGGGAVPFYSVDEHNPTWLASKENGGALDTGAYDANRNMSLGASNNFLQSAQGAGPSVAGQQYQNSQDANIAAAMQAQTNSRGPGAAAAAGNILGAETSAGQSAAGQDASTVATEQQHGQQNFLQSMLAQRSQDLAMAKAKQQASFQNAELQAGVTLQQQSLLKNILGGAGQAAVAGAQAFGKWGGGDETGFDASADSNNYDPEVSRSRADAAFDGGEQGAAGDFDVGAGDSAAKGGEVTGEATQVPAEVISVEPSSSEREAWKISPNATYVQAVPTSSIPILSPADKAFYGLSPDATQVPAEVTSSVPLDEKKRAKDFIAALERRRKGPRT